MTTTYPPTKAHRWLPLFEGEEAAEVQRTIDAISQALAPLAGAPLPAPSDPASSAATAVLYAYLDRALPGRGHLASAEAALEAAITALNDLDLPPALYGGYTGVGWAVEHLREQLSLIDAGTNDSVDEGVLEWLRLEPWDAHYDLISGLVGIGVYALERLPEPGGVACLERVIDHLARIAQVQPEGMTWWTRPELLLGPSLKACPQGCYNLGMAHGIPGVIALLGEALAPDIADIADIARARVRPLLTEAVRWLLKHRQPESAGAAFPSWLPTGRIDPPGPSRLAWCYGDLGVAVALLGAARRAGETAWEAAALDIARRAAQRPRERSGIVDAGLCHGAAGLGHLFNRLWQATGEPLFADSARSWLRHTLSLRKDGQGLAGYLSYNPSPDWLSTGDWSLGWSPDASFLTGVPGIALALLGAVSPIAPDWDRLLLIGL